MRHDTAPTALGVKIVTGAFLVVTVVLLGLSYRYGGLLIVGSILAVISVICYVRSPVAYDISNRVLTVLFRAGSKEFGPIVACKKVPGKFGMTLRLWGNSGLFSGTGIYWNRKWGIFRAYVTTSDRAVLVLVETPTHKVLVSPADSQLFVDDAITGSSEDS